MPNVGYVKRTMSQRVETLDGASALTITELAIKTDEKELTAILSFLTWRSYATQHSTFIVHSHVYNSNAICYSYFLFNQFEKEVNRHDLPFFRRVDLLAN